MENSSSKTAANKPSAIPRLSRLPVPRGAVNLPAAPDLDIARSKSNAPRNTSKSSTLQHSAQNLGASTAHRTGNSINRFSAMPKPLRENGGYNALPRNPSTSKTESTEPTLKQKGDIENMASGTRDRAEVQEEPEKALTTAHRRPRPSLSDRTSETLSRIPPSPSPSRRQSNFFPLEAPSETLVGPASSLSQSRPSTSHGYHPPLPRSRPASPTKHQMGNQAANVTPSRRSVSSYAPRSVSNPQKRPNLPSNTTPSKVRPSPSKAAISQPMNISGKYIANTSSDTSLTAITPYKEAPPATSTFTGSSHVPAAQGNPRFQAQKTTPSRELGKRSTEEHTPKSSAALRETIAKAKAAQRTAAKSKGKAGFGNGFEIQVDTSVSILHKKIKMALEDGKLNIAALGFKEMPKEVINMTDFDSLESVDITRMNAADNKLEKISDEVFPDIDSEVALAEDENFLGLFFGGLESLDVHGNRLLALPKGLRRLDNLTTLNVSKNRLINANLDTVAEIPSLRELRLAENALKGPFPISICSLQKLELLDLHDNAITDIPEDVEEMHSLSVLNVAGNRLGSLPLHALSSIPLSELDASRNRLSGALVPHDQITLPNMKSLSVASNALTSLTTPTSSGNLTLPNIHTLNIPFNRIKSLPEISTWATLITLSAANNQLSCIPERMITLQHLSTVDLGNNAIKAIEQGLGNMQCLKRLNIEGNPLRQGERRLLGLSTEDLKSELRARSGGAQAGDD